jgi:hypothetical protein
MSSRHGTALIAATALAVAACGSAQSDQTGESASGPATSHASNPADRSAVTDWETAYPDEGRQCGLRFAVQADRVLRVEVAGEPTTIEAMTAEPGNEVDVFDPIPLAAVEVNVAEVLGARPDTERFDVHVGNITMLADVGAGVDQLTPGMDLVVFGSGIDLLADPDASRTAALLAYDWAHYPNAPGNRVELMGNCSPSVADHLDRVATSLDREPSVGLVTSIIESGPAFADNQEWDAVLNAYQAGNVDPEIQLEQAWDTTPPDQRQYYPGEIPKRLQDETRILGVVFNADSELTLPDGAVVFVRTPEAISYAADASITEPAIVLVPDRVTVPLEVYWKAVPGWDDPEQTLANFELPRDVNAILLTGGDDGWTVAPLTVDEAVQRAELEARGIEFNPDVWKSWYFPQMEPTQPEMTDDSTQE